MRNLGPTALVIMGVAGSGKSVCGAALAGRLGIDFIDGDDLHPLANVAKMHGGAPLTDADRWPWLDRVGAALGDRDAHPRGVAVACSALRKAYRARIRASGVGPTFVFLDIVPEEARRRLAERQGHFMPASLVGSQFETLEDPEGEGDVVRVRETGGVAETVEAVLAALDHEVARSNRSSDRDVIDSNKREHDVVRKPVPTSRHHAPAGRSLA